MLIRRAALDACGSLTPEEPMKEYLFALVVHLLKYATGEADECADEKKDPLSAEIEERRRIRIWYAHYAAAKAVETIPKTAVSP